MLVFDPHPEADYRNDYQAIVEEINCASEEDPARFVELLRKWTREDLFFLMYFVLRVNLNHPWLVERIKEVEACNDRTLDLWAREHWKSTVITYGLNVQEILRNPEIRIGIFSHTRTLAKAFLHRIKYTFESNQVLKTVFADILWQNPQYDSPRWSLDEGIIVRRQGIYQEATVEANGLVDGMPTGKHYDVLHYDDVVTEEGVTTAEQIAKIDNRFRLSFNLGAVDHITGKKGKARVIGTPYHYNDQYSKMEKDGGWIVRKHPCIDEAGKPVLLSEEVLAEKRIDMGIYIFSCQMLISPTTKENQRFNEDWIKYYRELPSTLSLYLLCDPANEKKKKAGRGDYSVFWLWGIDSQGNKFWLDCVRDRLTLTERWKAIKGLKKKYPRIQRIGYEQYGMTADIQHYEKMMEIEGFYFNIIELGGNKLSKDDRILRLVPSFEQRKVYFPENMYYTDKMGNTVDLVDIFIQEEYLKFPFCKHDDLLDAASRIEDKALEVMEPYDDMDDFDDAPMTHDIDRFFNRRPEGDDTSFVDPWTGYSYTPDTEVLTYEGWKPISGVEPNKDLALTMNPESRKLEYRLVEDLIITDYNDLVIEWSSDVGGGGSSIKGSPNAFDIVVTPNHPMVTAHRITNKVKLFPAYELAGRTTETVNHNYNQSPLTGIWDGEFKDDYINIPGYADGAYSIDNVEWDSVAYALFMGIFLSEGSRRSKDENNFTVQIPQKERDMFIEGILNDSPFNWQRYEHESIGHWVCNSRQLYKHLDSLGLFIPAPQKSVPDIIKKMSSYHIDSFLDAYITGDGSVRGVRSVIYTSSVKMADDIQELMIKAGCNCSLTSRDRTGPSGRFNKQGHEFSANFPSYAIYKNKRVRGDYPIPKVKHYSGKVYNIAVQRNDIVCIRRNGKPVFCGAVIQDRYWLNSNNPSEELL